MEEERKQLIYDIYMLEKYGIFIPFKALNTMSITELEFIRKKLIKQYKYENLKRSVSIFLKLSFEMIRKEMSPDMIEIMQEDPDFNILFTD